MRRLVNGGWRVRLAGTALLALIGALTLVAGAMADAGNPIPNTIKAITHDNGDGTVTVSVRGEWNWLSHSADCNYDRAATGAAIAWDDPNGADNTRAISKAVRNNNVVTLTTATQSWSVGDQHHRHLPGEHLVRGHVRGHRRVGHDRQVRPDRRQPHGHRRGTRGRQRRRQRLEAVRERHHRLPRDAVPTTAGTSTNPNDREVHPVDVGNVPADGQGPLPGVTASTARRSTRRSRSGPDAGTGLGELPDLEGRLRPRAGVRDRRSAIDRRDRERVEDRDPHSDRGASPATPCMTRRRHHHRRRRHEHGTTTGRTTDRTS